jgi:hypothetical protein
MADHRKRLSVGIAATSLTGVALSMGVGASVDAVAAVRPTTPPSGQPRNAAGEDVTDYTLSCQKASGRVTFSPALTMAGSTSELTVTFKVKLGTCTANPPPAGGPAVTVKSGAVTGSFTSVDPGCPGLLENNSVQGSMTAKFKASPELTSGNADVTLSSVQGGSNAVGDLVFNLPAVGAASPGATGSFSGLDSGATDAFSANAGPLANITKKCDSSNGLSSLTFKQGNASFG